MLALVLVRGLPGIRHDAKDTLKMLRLNRKMHCVVVPASDSYKGMIKKVRNYITYGELDEATLKLLVQKRGRKPGNMKLTEKEAAELISIIKAGKKISDGGFKPVFRLTPPSGGFKGEIKQHYPKGEVGNRGKEINKLLVKMI